MEGWLDRLVLRDKRDSLNLNQGDAGPNPNFFHWEYLDPHYFLWEHQDSLFVHTGS